MYILYAPSAICFETRLKNRGVSPTVIKRNLWKWHYVFTFVLDRLTLADGESESKQLNIGKLDKVLGSTSQKGSKNKVRYSKIVLDDLARWGVLLRRHDNANNRTKVMVKITDETLQSGYSIWQLSPQYQPCPVEPHRAELTGVYADIAANFSRIEFDATAARAFTHLAFATKLRLPDKRKQNVPVRGRYVDAAIRSHWLKCIDGMETQDWRATADEKTGRLFSRLSNLPKHLRQFLTIDGKMLEEVDISASQCLVFAILLKRHFGIQLPDDVAKYVRLCEQGQFYQTVKPLVVTEAERGMEDGMFKVTFFARVFFSNEKRTYAWRTRFAEHFPTVSAFITASKAGCYKDLPRQLSHLESEIMLHRITPRLLAEGITDQFSVHDSFYCTQADRAHIEQIVREEYRGYGVTPHIKVKPSPAPAQVASTAPTDDELIARLEAQFAAFEANELDTQLQPIALGADEDDFFKD